MFSYFFPKSTSKVKDQFQQGLNSRESWKSERFNFSNNQNIKIYPIKEKCSLCHFYGVCSNCDLRNKK
jgi:hypothetical protein